MEAWERASRINENDLFKHDWRSRSKVQVLQYIFLKWTLAFLVGLLTGIIATFINLAVENIAGYKHLSVVRYIEEERYLMGFIFFTGVNFILTMVAAVLCVCFTPTAVGPGIPEIKAYLDGVDTPNMFGATTLIVKCFKWKMNMERKVKPQKAKGKTSEGRKQLSSVRVIQRNLVYIVRLPLNLADEDLLQQREYFGQYGKVLKSCSNPDCLYLHEIGTQEDSFTKDGIISAYTRNSLDTGFGNLYFCSC
ncbi:unnamed protein product [Camellia sinensis]